MKLAKLTNNDILIMTSKSISELVESRHDKVKQSIERLVDRGVISQPPLVDGEKSANGVVEKVYLIGKRDSYVIVAQLSPEFTARLVDRWQELESGQVPKTLSSALRLAADQAEQIERLQLQAQSDAPKVEFAMAVRRMEGACKIGDFGKVIGIGRNILFSKLRADEILMADNMPYQKYIDQGWFVVIEQVPYVDHAGKSHHAFTTMVTGKGQVALEKKYRKE